MLSFLLSAPKHVTLLAAATAAAFIAGSTEAMFRFDCHNNLVVDRTDPIVNFGTASGHLHAVAGGNGFSMTADGAAMERSTCTSCPIGADLSAYWVPQMYVKFKNGTGFGLVEGGQIVYYEQRALPGEKLVAFPSGFQMIAGTSSSRTGGDAIDKRAITWACLDYANPHPEQQGIPNFKCPQGLRGQVNFPMCWDGKNLDSPDHKSHVAYAADLDGGACPSSHPVKMIKLFYEIFYSVDKYDNEWVDGKHPFVLANGDASGYGFHGDFLNGWDKNVLQAAIDQCADKNYFDPAECLPLRPTYKAQPPAQRCTRPRQVIEPIDKITALPGNNPVTGPAPTPAPTVGVCTTEAGVDYIGNDVGTATGAKATDCCASCAKFPNARVFSWTKGGTCYCKSSKGSTAANADITSGTVGGSTPAPSTCTIENGTDFVGNDVGAASASKASDCCSACASFPTAKAFTYAPGTCYCKSAKGTTKANADLTSGVFK